MTPYSFSLYLHRCPRFGKNACGFLLLGLELANLF
jgi:hypothetical protein